MPAPDGPITAVRLDGLSWNDAFCSSCLPPGRTVVRPSAYKVNSCVVAEAMSCTPSQRKVWLPTITSEPTASSTEPATRCPLTKVPLKLPRSRRTAARFGPPRSSSACRRLTSASSSTTSLSCSRPMESRRPAAMWCGSTTDWPCASWPGGTTACGCQASTGAARAGSCGGGRLRHHSASGAAGWCGGGAGAAAAGTPAAAVGTAAGRRTPAAATGAATRLTTTASAAGPPRCRLSGLIGTASRLIRWPRTNVPLLLVSTTTQASDSRCRTAWCREAAGSLTRTSQSASRPITTRSPSNVLVVPAHSTWRRC